MDKFIDYDMFSGETKGRIAVIRFKENLLSNLTNLNAKEKLFSFFRKTELDNDVRVVLIMGAPRRTDTETCRQFYQEFASGKAGIDDLERLNNAINQLVLKINGYSKMVIHAGQGNTAPVFANLSLACDWRIIAEDTLFQNPCLDLGLIPKGGGVYFLSRLMGRDATADMLFSGKDVDARAALALGLVNRVVKTDALETEAIEAANAFAQKSARALWAIKRLINYPSKELSAFLEYEDDLIRSSYLCSMNCSGMY
ncbi:MAG: enoyl-CoA hydratase-related protein [Pseudomonadota bacterium]